MKTYHSLVLQLLVGLFLLLMTSIFPSNRVYAKRNAASADRFSLPATAHWPQPKGPQSFHVITDYFNHAFDGKLVDKIRVSGDFTTNLPGNHEKWNHVLVIPAKADADFVQGEVQSYMEDFSYIPSAEMLQPTFFKGFPLAAVQTKNLVWDMAAIEGFAWAHLDSLRLNHVYQASKMNGDAQLAGLGTFSNRDILLIYRGLTHMNGEDCAIIDFRAMDNPLEVNLPMNGKDFHMKGVSHYWGSIYVSLKEKRLAWAELLESVSMETRFSDQPVAQYGYATRHMTVEKIH